jgi:hypothetical protein
MSRKSPITNSAYIDKEERERGRVRERQRERENDKNVVFFMDTVKV